MSDKQTCNEEMSSIKIKEFIKLDQIRSTKSIKIIQNIFQYSCIIIAALEGKWLCSRRCKEWAVLWKRWRVLASWCALLKPPDFQMHARSDPTICTDGWTFGYLPWPFIFGPEHRFEWEDVRNFIGRHKNSIKVRFKKCYGKLLQRYVLCAQVKSLQKPFSSDDFGQNWLLSLCLRVDRLQWTLFLWPRLQRPWLNNEDISR